MDGFKLDQKKKDVNKPAIDTTKTQEKQVEKKKAVSMWDDDEFDNSFIEVKTEKKDSIKDAKEEFNIKIKEELPKKMPDNLKNILKNGQQGEEDEKEEIKEVKKNDEKEIIIEDVKEDVLEEDEEEFQEAQKKEERVIKDFDDAKEEDNAPLIASIISSVGTILKDKRRASHYKKVIAAAKVINAQKDQVLNINDLLAFRDAVSNYLVDRGEKSIKDRKTLCENLVRDINAYAVNKQGSSEHDLSYLTKEYRLADVQIDTEIMLAHRYTEPKSGKLSEISYERRELFRKRMEQVKLAGYIKDSIKRKDDKRNLLFDENGLGVEEGDDRFAEASRDMVLAYARLHDMSDEEAVGLLSRLRGDEEGQKSRQIKMSEIKLILSDILSWDLKDFAYDKPENFFDRSKEGVSSTLHFKRMKAKLDMVKNVGAFLSKLSELDENLLGGDDELGGDEIREIKARVAMLTEVGKDYDEQLSLMSSPYYALLTNEDVEKISVNDAEKKSAPEAFKSYIRAIQDKKNRRKDPDRDKKGEFKNGTKPDSLIKHYRTKVGAPRRYVPEEGHDIKEDIKKKLRSDLKKAGYKEAEIEEIMLIHDTRDAVKDASKERKKIDAEMKNVQDRSFIPVERPRHRSSGWTYLKNGMFLGLRGLSRITIGLAAGVGTTIASVFTSRNKPKDAQLFRQHEMVPGRKGEEFEDKNITDDEDETRILSDTRRGPLVWEKLTAGDPEDPPELCIMTVQGKRGSTIAANGIDGGEYGHSLIGLSYSRYNKFTKRKERYQLRIGYNLGAGTMASMGLKLVGLIGASGAGQIKDNTDSSFDVGRKYQIKPGDVNRILKAMSKYSDGGYNSYKRNCTTFAVDMAKLAHVPVGDEVKEETLEIANGANAVLNLVSGIGYSGYKGAKNDMKKRMGKTDKSYANFGQKLYTEEDYKNLKSSYKNQTEFIHKGYSPGVLGETLREQKDGELTASYREHLNARTRTIGDMIPAVNEAGEKLKNRIIRLVGEDKLTKEDDQIIKMIDGIDREQIEKIADKGKKADSIRRVHAMISGYMKKLNHYYATRMKQDASLNDEVMEFLSLCEVTLGVCNAQYEHFIDGAIDSDSKRAFVRYTSEKKGGTISVREKNKKAKSCKLAAGIYEGYLMSGKKPIEIVEVTNRRNALKKKEKDGKKLSSKEKRELAVLDREYGVASDFAKANTYILGKEDYSRKDIKYAFYSLPKIENGQNADVKVEMDNKPSVTYQVCIMERVFAGMKDLEVDGKGKTVEENVSLIEEHVKKGMTDKPKYMKEILKAFATERDEDNAEDIAKDFISGPFSEYLKSAQPLKLVKYGKSDPAGDIISRLSERSEFKTMLINAVEDGRKIGE